MAGRVKNPKLAAAYVVLFIRLQEIAEKHGYALAPHGTLATDLDLIAVPWVHDAEPVEDLIAALQAEIGGTPPNPKKISGQPERKPHGRLAWSFYFDPLDAKRCDGPYIDISVLPRMSEADSKEFVWPSDKK